MASFSDQEWMKVEDVRDSRASTGRLSSRSTHGDGGRSTSYRKSYENGRDEGRRSDRKSNNLGRDDRDELHRSSRKSRDEGERRSLSRRDEGAESEASTETLVYVEEEQEWKAAAEVFRGKSGDLGDTRRSTRKSHGYPEGESRQSLASRASCARGDCCSDDGRRSVPNRKSYNLGCDEGDVRRSVASRKSYDIRDDEGDVRRSVANRKSYDIRDDEGDVRRSVASRKSYDVRDDEGDARRSLASRKSYDDRDDGGDVRRSLAIRKSYDVRDDEGDARRSLASRKSYDVRDDEGDARRSLASRKSYDVRDDEGDARRSVASRKSYDVRDDEGESRRSIANRKSLDVRDEEGDGRRSVSNRKSYDLGRDDEGDARRSLASRKSYDVRDDEGESRRSLANRTSYAECERRSTNRASKDEGFPERRSRGSRMLSQPPPGAVPEIDSSESEIYTGAREGFQRKSQVRGSTPRAGNLTLELDADSPEQMKSIIWKFSDHGACVKVLNKNCPQASPEDIRPGDVLAFINEEYVLGEAKAFIQRTWKEEQQEKRFLTLRFKLDREV